MCNSYLHDACLCVYSDVHAFACLYFMTVHATYCSVYTWSHMYVFTHVHPYTRAHVPLLAFTRVRAYTWAHAPLLAFTHVCP